MKFCSARKGRMKMLKQKHIFNQAQKKKWSKVALCARIAFSAKDTQTKKSSKKFTLSTTVFSKEGVCFSLHIFVFCTCACIVYVRHFCSATSCSQTAWMVHQRRQQNCISMCQLFRLFRVTDCATKRRNTKHRITTRQKYKTSNCNMLNYKTSNLTGRRNTKRWSLLNVEIQKVKQLWGGGLSKVAT